jgi:hypothetical protein
MLVRGVEAWRSEGEQRDDGVRVGKRRDGDDDVWPNKVGGEMIGYVNAMNANVSNVMMRGLNLRRKSSSFLLLKRCVIDLCLYFSTLAVKYLV